MRLNYVRTGSAIMFGAKTFIKKRFSASSFWKDCYKYQITVRKQLVVSNMSVAMMRKTKKSVVKSQVLKTKYWKIKKLQYSWRGKWNEMWHTVANGCDIANWLACLLPALRRDLQFESRARHPWGTLS